MTALLLFVCQIILCFAFAFGFIFFAFYYDIIYNIKIWQIMIYKNMYIIMTDWRMIVWENPYI